ncbi:DegT/DnrJ/EryC1/StrS family aminotransferase [Pseudonocardia sp. NPDC049635]|uniref:DegT/DnrJ/EryC1/StrS family aminotransferase n=1 Tax=Pseudonocardia sp. NPDC049635 TaxID=3155506 RepID=UPI0033DA409B
MSRYRVPFAARGSILGQREAAVLHQLVHEDTVLSSGALRAEFERRMAAHLGVRHALSVTSGTVALELAIGLLDLAPGDEVLVTPQTFQATVQPLLDTPATVRFCDIDPATANIDPSRVEEMLTERTRAVVLVHYGGLPADMDRITAATRPRGVVVIEDCAHALGADYRGRRPGSLGDIGCFSFHSSKNITTLGEGGLITVDRDDWARRIDRRRSNEVDADLLVGPHPDAVPESLPWMRWSERAYGQACSRVRRSGTNATLSEAAAAVGLVQLDRLPELHQRRAHVAARLDEVLAGQEGVRLTRTEPGTRSGHHLYTFFVERPGVRDALVRALDARSVEVQLRYFPQHLMPEWRARGPHGPGECPVAEASWFGGHMNLPCHPHLTDTQIDHLTDALDDALREVSRAPSRPGASDTEATSCPSST